MFSVRTQKLTLHELGVNTEELTSVGPQMDWGNRCEPCFTNSKTPSPRTTHWGLVVGAKPRMRQELATPWVCHQTDSQARLGLP